MDYRYVRGWCFSLCAFIHSDLPLPLSLILSPYQKQTALSNSLPRTANLASNALVAATALPVASWQGALLVITAADPRTIYPCARTTFFAAASRLLLMRMTFWRVLLRRVRRPGRMLRRRRRSLLSYLNYAFSQQVSSDQAWVDFVWAPLMPLCSRLIQELCQSDWPGLQPRIWIAIVSVAEELRLRRVRTSRQILFSWLQAKTCSHKKGEETLLSYALHFAFLEEASIEGS